MDCRTEKEQDENVREIERRLERESNDFHNDHNSVANRPNSIYVNSFLRVSQFAYNWQQVASVMN